MAATENGPRALAGSSSRRVDLRRPLRDGALRGKQALRPVPDTDAQQVQAKTTHEGRCHWFEGATSEMRLKYGSRIFNVESVVNEREQNRFLVWRLEEVSNGT